MSYELSFSEEFFTDETFPYDTQSSRRPTNVWQAIISLPPISLKVIGQDVFKLPNKIIKGWIESEQARLDILDKVRETNTCSNLTVPVQVWIDPKGDYTLKVYE
jgi:hypothetical protein